MSDKKIKSWKRIIAEEAFAFGKTSRKIGMEFVGSAKNTSGLRSDILVFPKTLESDLYKAMTKGKK